VAGFSAGCDLLQAVKNVILREVCGTDRTDDDNDKRELKAI
jgi:hypothetical protein